MRRDRESARVHELHCMHGHGFSSLGVEGWGGMTQSMPAPQLSRVGLCAPPRHVEYVRPSPGRSRASLQY